MLNCKRMFSFGDVATFLGFIYGGLRIKWLTWKWKGVVGQQRKQGINKRVTSLDFSLRNNMGGIFFREISIANENIHFKGICNCKQNHLIKSIRCLSYHIKKANESWERIDKK